jgi:alpha-galactosidase
VPWTDCRYDHVGCCANETTMKEQGQALIDTGLQKLGFVYVNSDCGWMGGRHPNGTLYESPTKFRESRLLLVLCLTAASCH